MNRRIKKNVSHKPSSARTRGLVIGVVAMFALLGGWLWWSSLAPPLSDDGYPIAVAIYAACNLADQTRLDAAMAVTEKSQISSDEKAHVRRIIELTKAGQWERAATKAKSWLESLDQS